jgi:hypothetical protein
LKRSIPGASKDSELMKIEKIGKVGNIENFGNPDADED